MDNASIEDAVQSTVARLGFTEVKVKQKEAVVAFASGKDVFVSLLNGYSKSICYACLPYLFDILGQKSDLDKAERVGSMIVVVTPLIAIMHEGAERVAD